MRTRTGVAVLVAALVLTVAGCGSDDPETTPPVAQGLPSAAPTSASPSPSPSPSVSPSPLSPFEEDPAVQGLRTYVAAVAEAVNAKNLQLPALVAAGTARRVGLHQQIYGEEVGTYYPYPNPVAVLGVRVVSPTARTVLACSQEDGLTLDKPGGTPVEPVLVVGGQYEMLLEDGRWKVNRAVGADDVSCDGVMLQRRAT